MTSAICDDGSLFRQVKAPIACSQFLVRDEIRLTEQLCALRVMHDRRERRAKRRPIRGKNRAECQNEQFVGNHVLQNVT